MIYDGYTLFERFCIMTVDGKVDERMALIFLKNKTTDKLYEWLVNKIKEQT